MYVLSHKDREIKKESFIPSSRKGDKEEMTKSTSALTGNISCLIRMIRRIFFPFCHTLSLSLLSFLPSASAAAATAAPLDTCSILSKLLTLIA